MQPNNIKPWQIITTYLHIVKVTRKWVILCFALFFTISVNEAIIVKNLYRYLVDSIIDIENLGAQSAYLIIGGIILAKIYSIVTAGIADYILTGVRAKELKRIYDYCFEYLPQHSYNFFSTNFTGSLVAKVKRFVSSYDRGSDRLLFNGIITGTELSCTLIVLLFVATPIGIFFTIWTIIYIAAIAVFAQYKLPLDTKKAAKDSIVTAKNADALTNILLIKVFGNHRSEVENFAAATEEERVSATNTWRLDNYFRSFQAFALLILEVVALSMAIYLWEQGRMTVGTIVLLQAYLLTIMGRLWELRRAITDVFVAFSDASEMSDILNTPPAVKDPPTPIKLTCTQGSLQFNDVNFGYNEGNPILQNFSVHIPAKQHVGIVGPSGAGKTTLFKLLLRFLDIHEGNITIDNQNITQATQDDVRTCFGYVSQEPYMFHRSLSENIAYGKPDATKADIIKAAKQAHAHEFISTFPEEYNTLVGERGIKLSGGERQRVALARIILQNAPILLFDEATSALDSVSEKYIQSNLTEIMAGKTALVIAHRISTIKQLDRIIVMQHGNIVEDGTHQQLLKNRDVYAELWEHQQDGFIK